MRKTAGKVLVVRVSEKLQQADYEHLVPVFERLVRNHGKLRVLFDMTDFHGWEAGALWQDIKFDFKHSDDIERLALVGERKWQQGMATFCKAFTTATIRYFDHADATAARHWLDKNRKAKQVHDFMSQTTRFLLSQAAIPKQWYNLLADFPEPLPPPLHPGTRQPMSPEMLTRILPENLVRQEMCPDRWVEIPAPVRAVYALWRPTPLLRAARFERALQTPAHIYYNTSMKASVPQGATKSTLRFRRLTSTKKPAPRGSRPKRGRANGDPRSRRLASCSG